MNKSIKTHLLELCDPVEMVIFAKLEKNFLFISKILFKNKI